MKKILVIKIFENLEYVYTIILNLNVLVKEIHQCINTFAIEKKKVWMKEWHDMILINYDRFNIAIWMMKRRWVAWLWYFFIINVLDNFSLMLVQWFECKKNPEWLINIYLIIKSDKYEIIKLSIIECGVHLISNYESIETITLWMKMQEQRIKISRELNAYDKFIINNYLNLDKYNIIY